MINKRDLSRVFHISHEIEMWERELASLDGDSLISSPASQDGLPHGSGTNESRQEIKALNKMTIEQTISELLEELKQTQREVTTWIETLDDSYIRQILFYRCVKAKSWQQVVNAMGYGTAEGIRKAYERFVRKEFEEK